jgi:putative ABC transport system ATP-binding protein
MVGPKPRRNAGLALEVRGVRIVRVEPGQRPRTLLDVARFDAPAQAQVAFVGPSGTGKTRLVRVLAALERPERGSVRWGAVNVTEMDPSVATDWRRVTVGIVGSGFPLLRALSAYQNVLLPARLPGLRVSRMLREKARALLDLAGVPEHLTMAALAPADVRRVEIARALVRSPAVVLADEPTADLSTEAGAIVMRTLRLLAGSAGATLVIATRDAATATAMDLCYELAGLASRRD